MNSYVMLLAMLSGLFAALGGFFAKKQKDRLHLVLAFSGGSVLAVALCHLLPESVELIGNIRLAVILAVTGFVVIMAGDQLFSIHEHKDCENPSHRGRFATAAMILHGVVDGIAVAMAFLASPAVGVGVTTAVLAHKFSDGINVSASAMRDDPNSVLAWISLNTLAPIFGAAIALWLAPPQVFLGPTLAVFAGMFLYVGSGVLIPESHHEHPALTTTLMTILGMATVLGLSNFLR